MSECFLLKMYCKELDEKISQKAFHKIDGAMKHEPCKSCMSFRAFISVDHYVWEIVIHFSTFPEYFLHPYSKQ